MQELDLRPRGSIKRSRLKALKRTLKTSPLPHFEEKPGRTSALSKRALESLRSLPRRQFFFKDGVADFMEPGCLDLFSGRFGVAKQLVKHGAPWVLTYEWNRSADENLLEQRVRKVIFELIDEGTVKALGGAPICSSFSVAVTPPVRNKRFPRGLPGVRTSMRQKIRDGNSQNDFMKDVIDQCEAHGIAYFVENPDTSFWWAQRRSKRWRSSKSEELFRLCFCRFGTPWKKATRIAANARLLARG